MKHFTTFLAIGALTGSVLGGVIGWNLPPVFGAHYAKDGSEARQRQFAEEAVMDFCERMARTKDMGDRKMFAHFIVEQAEINQGALSGDAEICAAQARVFLNISRGASGE